jgi:hypothetical protein
MPKVRTLKEAWLEMIETKRRQKVNPNYQFDTPVPSNKLDKNQKIKPLTDSIGDLAPESVR